MKWFVWVFLAGVFAVLIVCGALTVMAQPIDNCGIRCPPRPGHAVMCIAWLEPATTPGSDDRCSKECVYDEEKPTAPDEVVKLGRPHCGGKIYPVLLDGPQGCDVRLYPLPEVDRAGNRQFHCEEGAFVERPQ